MNINFSNLTKQIVVLLLAVFTAYILSHILYLLLPKKSLEFNQTNNFTLEYKKFNIINSFQDKIITQTKVSKIQQNDELLKSIYLKAIYVISDQKGWIIVSDKNNKTHILSMGESFNGYKLSKVYLNYVIFTKQSQEYKLEIKNTNKVNYSIDNTKLNNNINTVVLENQISINRTYINSYINNFDKIWKEILIDEIKDKNNNTVGFKVSKVSSKKVLAKFGFVQGDLITAINNTRLRSYNDIFSIYKKINNIKNLNILIIRDSKKIKLNYEIQ